jgi:hypothetical protein
MLLVQELALVPIENTLGASALVTPSVHTRELKPVPNNSILSPSALEKSVMVSMPSEGELNLNLSAPSPPVRVSFPPSPKKVSFPEPPTRLLLVASPVKVNGPAVSSLVIVPVMAVFVPMV